MRKITIEIDGLPKCTSNANLNWKARWVEAKKWKRIISNHVILNRLRPGYPLKKVHIRFTRFAHGKRPDDDNLLIGFKACRDALVESGLIADDSPDVVLKAEYFWEPAKPKQGKIRIEIEEIE